MCPIRRMNRPFRRKSVELSRDPLQQDSGRKWHDMRLLKTILVALAMSSAGASAVGCETPLPADALGSTRAMVPSWQTVWRDDFNQSELDRTNWTPEVSCWGGGNNERQCYADSPNSIQVEDGVLRLVARPQTHTGPLSPAHSPGVQAEERTQAYTSGKITTRGLHAWTYGRFSARMRLPEGQGTWPAFWMMPESGVYGPWPLSGEIDIMEAVNLGTPCEGCADGTEQRTSGALHFGDVMPNNTYLFSKTDGTAVPGPADAWRVYALEWGEGQIQWFVDGKLIMRIRHQDWHTAAPEAAGRPFAPFDQPFHLNVNLAVGGNLAEKSNGRGFDPSSFPAELQVDWIQVETCLGDPGATSCLDTQNWGGTLQGPWEGLAR